MSIFDLARLFSPIGGAVGGALAVHREAPTMPAWMWAAIPLGFLGGIGCYRGLIRLMVGKYDRNSDLPGWRMAGILFISFFSPCIAGGLAYGLFRWLFQVAAS